AWRVHGGGFAGTTLNFVPEEMVPGFVEEMESAFGPHCCQLLDIRPVGATELKI
ncbi:MAG: galactokinase, partial [Clostridiales bacterium]|nr:galactokinase [Clostridiales bacterium]